MTRKDETEKTFSFFGRELRGSETKRRAIEKALLYFSVAAGFSATSFIVHLAHDWMFFTSLGATTCILFTAPDSKAAAWWRVIAAHTVCAIIGAATQRFLGHGWIPCAVCVTTAVCVMDFFDIVHPPAAATSLVGFTSDLGFSVAFSPVFCGMCALVVAEKSVIYIVMRMKKRGLWGR